MENREKDLDAIRELFTALNEAWNNGDGTSYGECFTEDADYVTFIGQHLKGRKQIAEVHQWLFNGPLRGSKMESNFTSDFQPRYITPDVAVVHGIGEVKLADPEQDPNDRGSINTNVIVRQADKWLIAAFHNCRIQEMPSGPRS
ncbi:SgcJ/EcaC family oxidoreductase [Paenibacillus sp. FSL R5-0527]|uniref:SgcJ/EcaC family oxidoreductase n=1 Tax=Paenibacillus sp. FSL R5-0527 TaxID=2975321 RepID=UPI00097B05BB|nr:DUF4440 domain-containing protein [Paenibacillus macerans]